MLLVRLLVAFGAVYVYTFILNKIEDLPPLKWVKGSVITNVVLTAIGFIIFLGVLLYPTYKAEKRRTRGLNKIAIEMGFTFHHGEFQPDPSLLQSQLLRRGYRRRFGPALTGKHKGVETALFDYQYFRPGEASDTADKSYSHTVVAFYTPGFHIADFVMVAESVGDRVFSALFGDSDIDFEDDSKFSRRYVLSGPNEGTVRDVFGPKLRAALVRSETDWAAAGIDNKLILFADGDSDQRVSAADLVNYFERAWALFEVIRSTHGSLPPAETGSNDSGEGS